MLKFLKHFSVSEMLKFLFGHQNVKPAFSHKNDKFKNIFGFPNFLTEKVFTTKVVQLKCHFQNSQIQTIGYHFILRKKEITEVI
jgi:hypothetical protein